MFDFERLEQEEGRLVNSLAVHENASEVVRGAASRTVENLLWCSSPETAQAVALFGPGLVALPLLGQAAGRSDSPSASTTLVGCGSEGWCDEDRRFLAYASHPSVANGGVIDRAALEAKFGQLDPERLLQEFAVGAEETLHARLPAMCDEDLKGEVIAIRGWLDEAGRRLRTLERRAAWSMLGIPCQLEDQAEVKRAFKRKALELHPDKGGDEERFKLLQKMKDVLNDLVEPKPEELTTVRQAVPGGPIDRSWYVEKRLALHRQVFEMGARAGKLAAEIKKNKDCNTSGPCSSDSVKHLRAFVEKFGNLEISKLTTKDPEEAERIFCKFLEQGTEVICAAGVQDTSSTIANVVQHVAQPLMSAAPSESLRERCALLFNAIKAAPLTFQRCNTLLQPAIVGQQPEDGPIAPEQVCGESVSTETAGTSQTIGEGHPPDGVVNTGGDVPDASSAEDDRSTSLKRAVTGDEATQVSRVTLEARVAAAPVVKVRWRVTFEVVFTHVVVRSSPFRQLGNLNILGRVFRGQVLYGSVHDVGGEPWLMVDAPCRTNLGIGTAVEAWVLISGCSLGLGELLREIPLGTRPSSGMQPGFRKFVASAAGDAEALSSEHLKGAGVSLHKFVVEGHRGSVITAESLSGRAIRVLGEVPAVGGRCHFDRRYTFTSLGDFANRPSMLYILTCNEDKGTSSDKVMWKVHVEGLATVHLNFRSEAHVTPVRTWLRTRWWVRSGMESTVSNGIPNGPYSGPVYSRTFEDETAELMGSNSSEGTYFVFVEIRSKGT